MKHRLAIPYIDGPDIPDVPGWVYERGWDVEEVTFIRGPQLRLRPGAEEMRIRITPFRGHPVQITATSGATLVYDDIDRSMAVTLEPEPEDAVPTEPRDEVPISKWLGCPNCGRLWSDLPKFHTYTSHGGCFDVPREDAVPVEPEDAKPWRRSGILKR